MSDQTKPAENKAKKWKIGQPVTNEDFMHDGEQILWEGRPGDFKVVSPQSKREILWKWFLLPIIFLALILLHIRFSDVTNVALITGLILLAVILAGTVFLKRKKILKCRYLLTGERVVLVNNDYAYYIRLEDLDGFRVVRDQTENPSVVFGSAIYGEIKHRLLQRAASDIITDRISGDEASCFNLVFYNVIGAEELISKLHSVGAKED